MSGTRTPGTGDDHTLADLAHQALALARRGPSGGANPQVGAVVAIPASGSSGATRPGDGDACWRVLGEGWHHGAGTPHAEVEALRDARQHGHDARGATVVVSLQPCNSSGRTPPCTQALLAAGVARVVFSSVDPAATAARSTQTLRAGGIEVIEGLARQPADELLRSWFTSVRLARPYVTLKTAVSLDGRVAAADGTSRWITGDTARAYAHRVRQQVGAVLVGTGTALADDPELTARNSDGSRAAHQPVRAVMGRRQVPDEARLRGPGGPLVPLVTHDPAVALATLLDEHGVRHVLVEGGPTLATVFLRAGLVDEIDAYLAPVVIGSGPSAIGDLGVSTITEAVRGRSVVAEQLGDDVHLRVRLDGGPGFAATGEGN